MDSIFDGTIFVFELYLKKIADAFQLQAKKR